jgi:o-succinylbenzoate synthase
MALRASYIKKTFLFNFDARTSRGQMKDKTSWFIKVWDERYPRIVGIGECGPLPGLSIDHGPDFEQTLSQSLDHLNKFARTDIAMLHLNDIVPNGYPSILFGMETAILTLSNGGDQVIFDNQFIRGMKIPINGLVWMGDSEFMLRQIDEKISKGFTCIKLKVGGINFDVECELLHHIRKRFSKSDITLRLDANGAFTPDDVFQRLKTLAQYEIHSIEQPLKAGTNGTEGLCRTSPIPIALDEELIGIEGRKNKAAFLDRLKPQFIVIKPSLHGGISGTDEWIELATERNIGWWITSALESNIGLNAICQLTARYTVTIPQGLGTGSIYENNIPSPLTVDNGAIYWDHKLTWKTSMINEE